MSRGVNMVVLVGNVGQDPEVRYSANGSAIANLSIATSAGWRDKQSGEMQERTEWHRAVVFNRLAEVVANYIKKGSKVYVRGSLRTRQWQDKQGMDRYTTEVVVDDLQMLDRKGEDIMGGASAPTENKKTNQPAAQPAAQTEPEQFEDDIPF